MLIQIAIGLGIIVLSIIVQVAFIEIAAQNIKRKYKSGLSSGITFFPFVTTLSLTTTWLLLGVLTIVTIWTALFLLLDVFVTGEESFYFSLVAFTTLGFGDITLPSEWRILSGFVATDGFLLFGLNTAVMLEIIIGLRGHLDDAIVKKIDREDSR